MPVLAEKKCEPVYSEGEWCDYLEGSYWIYQSNISDACVANVVIRNFSMIEKHGLLSMMFKEAEYSWYIWLFLMMFGWDITGVQANLSYAECRDFFSATAEFIYTGFCLVDTDLVEDIENWLNSWFTHLLF